MMLIAELIYPDSLKESQITCDECGIGYSNEDYSILFNSFKLAYFKVFSDELPVAKVVLCHECLFDFALDCTSNEETENINFKIYTKENEYDFTFEPEDFEELVFEDEDGESASMEHFLELIIDEKDE
tara:strand:+ start:666 stop:1049 length:384 start_codon:yes stop_codon:yes gene_type:complete